MSITKPLLVAAILMAPAGLAQASSDQTDRAVRAALKEYRIEADISSLSDHQKAMIITYAHSGEENGRRLRIRTVIEGGLFTLLFN